MATESVPGGSPILVLALGDVRSGDDGIGPALLADLAERYRYAVGSSNSSSEGDAGEVLATAAFLGDLPYCCYVIGVEPGASGTGAGFSKAVQRSLHEALARAQNVVDRLLAELSEPGKA